METRRETGDGVGKMGREGREGETNACTWRKGSCSFVEDIILGGCMRLSQILIYRSFVSNLNSMRRKRPVQLRAQTGRLWESNDRFA